MHDQDVQIFHMLLTRIADALEALAGTAHDVANPPHENESSGG